LENTPSGPVEQIFPTPMVGRLLKRGQPGSLSLTRTFVQFTIENCQKGIWLDLASQLTKNGRRRRTPKTKRINICRWRLIVQILKTHTLIQTRQLPNDFKALQGFIRTL